MINAFLKVFKILKSLVPYLWRTLLKYVSRVRTKVEELINEIFNHQ